MIDCEGCHRKMIEACALDLKEIRKCPCSICIVKGICAETCDERYKLWLNTYNR